MYRKKAFPLIIFCLLVPVFLGSCSGNGSQENVPLNLVQEVALDSILPNAITACDDAYSAPIRGGSIDQVAAVLHNIEYNADSSWELADYPHFARTPDELGSLICIKKTRVDVGTYSDNKTAYRQDWIVRVVSWPDGTVISEDVFTGGDPKGVKTHSDDSYGASPYRNFMGWAGDMSGGRFMFSVEELADFDLVHDGNNVVFSTSSYTGVWDPARSSTATIGEYGAAAIAYSPNEAIIAMGGYRGIVQIIDADSQEGIGALMPFNFKEIKKVVFSPDGKYLAAGTVGSVVSVWAPPQISAIFDLKELENPYRLITDLTFSPDSSLIAAAARQSKIVIWDTESGEEVTTIDKLPNEAFAVAFSPDGETLAICGKGFLSLWDPATGKQKSMLSQGTGAELDFSPDGQILAVSSGKNIRLWNLITEKELTPLAGHTDTITRIEFSSTGMLVSSAEDDTIRLWAMP